MKSLSIKAALLALVMSSAAACNDGSDGLEVTYLEDEEAPVALKFDGAYEPRVELKLALPEDQIDRAISRFKLKGDKATEREITFYDDARLSLYDSGLILRSRKVIDGPDDSTVKMRPLDPSEVDEDLFDERGFKCELDRTLGEAGGTSCSFTVEQDRGEIDDVADGDRSVKKLFSEGQEDFAETYYDVDWDELRPYGPVETLKWRIKVSGFDHKLTFELWFLPDGRDLMEVSCRVDADEAFEAELDLERYLADKGLYGADEQTSKTRAVLSFFAQP